MREFWMMSTKNEDFLKEFWIKSTNGEDLMKEFEINSTKNEDFMKEFWMKSTKDKSKVFKVVTRQALQNAIYCQAHFESPNFPKKGTRFLLYTLVLTQLYTYCWDLFLNLLDEKKGNVGGFFLFIK